jgi:hypothetical protein
MVLRLHKRRNLTGHPVAEGGPMIKMRLLVSVPLFAAMTGYSDGAGWAQFRIYTEESGVWAEPFIQALCTDGNWVDARGEQFVGPGSWMFLEADCPAPYSVSEAWVSIGLDY